MLRTPGPYGRSSVTDRGDDRPDPWVLPYASAPRIGCGDPLQFKTEHFDLRRQVCLGVLETSQTLSLVRAGRLATG